MSNFLTLDQIREVNDVQAEELDIPEWGGKVLVKAVSVEFGLQLLSMMQGEDGKVGEESAMKVSLLFGVDTPKFSEADWDWVKKKSLGALMKITQAFMRLNGFDAAGLKEARKNSSATGEGDSSSPSPAI